MLNVCKPRTWDKCFICTKREPFHSFFEPLTLLPACVKWHLLLHVYIHMYIRCITHLQHVCSSSVRVCRVHERLHNLHHTHREHDTMVYVYVCECRLTISAAWISPRARWALASETVTWQSHDPLSTSYRSRTIRCIIIIGLYYVSHTSIRIARACCAWCSCPSPSRALASSSLHEHAVSSYTTQI